MTRGRDYTSFISNNSSSTNTVYLVSNSSYIIPKNKDWCMEYDLNTANQIGVYLKGSSTGNYGMGYYNNEGWHHFKGVYHASTHLLDIYWNHQPLISKTVDLGGTSEYLRFGFEDWQNDMELYLKNFMLYEV